MVVELGTAVLVAAPEVVAEVAVAEVAAEVAVVVVAAVAKKSIGDDAIVSPLFII
jgi:hypothetical protein